MTPLEVGSDLAGSVRLPAHFCGVYGLMATEHRVPTTGFLRPPDDLPQTVRIMASLGPLARDLADLRLALGILAGPDHRDTDVPPVPLAAPHRVTLSELRLAAAPVVPGTPVAAGLRHQVERVAAQASDAGAKVEERLPDVAWEQLYELFQDLLGAITGLYDPSSDLRDAQRTLTWYLEALTRRDRFVTAWQEFFADVDALIAAPAMTTAFPHRDNDSTIDVDGQPVSYLGTGGALVYTNLTGLPSLVAPAGLDGGLPVGVQIIGPRWSESRLLDIAEALEQAAILPGFQAPAGYGQHPPRG